MSSPLFDEAMRLPQAERARLALELLDSLDDKTDEDAEEAWTDELNERIQQIKDGSATFEDWDSVRERTLSRLKKPS